MRQLAHQLRPMKRALTVFDAQDDAAADQVVDEEILREAVGTKLRRRDARRVEQSGEVFARTPGRKGKRQALPQSRSVDGELRVGVQDVGDPSHAAFELLSSTGAAQLSNLITNAWP